VTIAELYGKLSPHRAHGAVDRMEDLLTSDVFGTMRYATWSCGFLDWLLSAEAPLANGHPLLAHSISAPSVQDVQLAFWPSLPNGREGDVALLIQRHDGTSAVILVEAKYLSGMSDRALESEEVHDYRQTGLQLIDQVMGLARAASEHLTAWFRWDGSPRVVQRIHLLITRDLYLPIPIYLEAQTACPPPWPVSTFWLSWTTLVDWLRLHVDHHDPGRVALLQDLIDLLTRKNLVPFTGFHTTPWHETTPAPQFWADMWWTLAPLAIGASPHFWAPGVVPSAKRPTERHPSRGRSRPA